MKQTLNNSGHDTRPVQSPRKLRALFEEKYKDISKEDAIRLYSSPHPSIPSVMTWAIREMQAGINQAVKIYQKVKETAPRPFEGIKVILYYDEENPLVYTAIYTVTPYTHTNRKLRYQSVEEKLHAMAALEKYCREKDIEWKHELPLKFTRGWFTNQFNLIEEEAPIDLIALLK